MVVSEKSSNFAVGFGILTEIDHFLRIYYAEDGHLILLILTRETGENPVLTRSCKALKDNALCHWHERALREQTRLGRRIIRAEPEDLLMKRNS